jgi:tetratricopeptide (TPR) repeat protein
MRLSLKYSAAMAKRAEVWVACGNPRRSLADLDEAIAADPRYGPAYSQKAWLLATHRDDAIRDGKAAVEAAKKALGLSPKPDGETCEAVAAAHAAAGEFSLAVEWQKKALADIAYAKESREPARRRLELYEAGKAYRN